MNDELFLHERIEVVATFGSGLNPCRPVRFRRPNGREVVVKEIGLLHPKPSGKKTMHIFDITDGQADYRLELDSESLVWHLTMESDHVGD